MVREQRHIGFMFSFAEKELRKALDRHVGNGEEPVKFDLKILAQLHLVIGLKFFLWRRQGSSQRVINQIQRQPCSVLPIADCIQQP